MAPEIKRDSSHNSYDTARKDYDLVEHQNKLLDERMEKIYLENLNSLSLEDRVALNAKRISSLYQRVLELERDVNTKTRR